jgi:HSP20 family molecular chaperone IbpA
MNHNFDPIRDYFTDSDNREEMFSGIGDYVRRVLSQHFPESDIQDDRQTAPRSQRPHPQFNEKIIELHGFVILQIMIPEDMINNIIVETNSSQIVLYGMPSGEPKKIKLPCFIRPKLAKAIYRDELLEIRLPKTLDEPFQQIPIKRGS